MQLGTNIFVWGGTGRDKACGTLSLLIRIILHVKKDTIYMGKHPEPTLGGLYDLWSIFLSIYAQKGDNHACDYFPICFGILLSLSLWFHITVELFNTIHLPCNHWYYDSCLIQMIITSTPKITTDFILLMSNYPLSNPLSHGPKSLLLQHFCLIILAILYFSMMPWSPMPFLTSLTLTTITVLGEKNV